MPGPLYIVALVRFFGMMASIYVTVTVTVTVTVIMTALLVLFLIFILVGSLLVAPNIRVTNFVDLHADCQGK
jgi:hypothetical protein